MEGSEARVYQNHFRIYLFSIGVYTQHMLFWSLYRINFMYNKSQESLDDIYNAAK